MFLKKVKEAFPSLRARLILLYLGLMGATLVVFCTVLYSFFIRSTELEFDRALYNYAVDVAESVNMDLFEDFNTRTSPGFRNGKIFPFAQGQSLMQVVSPVGLIIAKSNNLGNGNLPFFLDDWPQTFREGATYETLSSQMVESLSRIPAKVSYRQITFLVRRMGNSFMLQIAAPLTIPEQNASNLLVFFSAGIPIALIIALIGGLFLSNRALAPVRQIIRKAEDLNPSNLSMRIPVPQTNDEIQVLSFTINGMLERIQKAFTSYENFIADASHQLKTPLAILRGELGVLLSRERDLKDYVAYAKSAEQELQHLSRLLDDLLLIAKMDAGAGSLTLKPVRLDEIILDTVSRIDILARQKNVSIHFNLENKVQNAEVQEFQLLGDSDLLQSMARNLLDNAIKYSPSGEKIDVNLVNFIDRIYLEISDRGPPISEEMRQKLFERYERGGEKVASGTGLGLPIARRIAELHNGNISIISDTKDLKTFRIEIKKI